MLTLVLLEGYIAAPLFCFLFIPDLFDVNHVIGVMNGHLLGLFGTLNGHLCIAKCGSFS